jgi:hypothetical protein
MLREGLLANFQRVIALHRAPYQAPYHREKFSVSSGAALLAGFKGWLRLTLEGALVLPSGPFPMKNLFDVCAPSAKLRYPQNRYVPDKLGQQLQVLHKPGLVEFMRKGCYLCTVK